MYLGISPRHNISERLEGKEYSTFVVCKGRHICKAKSMLKSVRVHLAPQIFAITSLNFVQFQKFKHQQLAYSPTIFWHLLQSSTPYQSGDHCMSHIQSIARAINCTECRRELFRNRGPSCSTENQVSLVEQQY